MNAWRPFHQANKQADNLKVHKTGVPRHVRMAAPFLASSYPPELRMICK